MILQSILTKKKTSVKTALSKSVPSGTKALPIFDGIAHVNECMGDGWLHGKTQ